MDSIKRITYLIVFCMLCSKYCIGQRAYSEEDQKQNLPAREVKLKLSKQIFSLNDTTTISKNAVFVVSDYLCGLKCDSLHTYMRFFNDGRIFVSFPYLSYPTTEEFNDLSYGKYGRYVIEKGEVIVELYMNKQYGVMFMFAKPVPVGVQFYATSFRKRALIKNRSTDGGYYKKNYPKLYNWPQ